MDIDEQPNPFAGEQWDEWINMRRMKRKSPTPYAIKLAIKTLAKLQVEGHDPGEVLDQSTLNGWTGLFEVKNNGTKPRQNGTEVRDPLLRRYLERGGTLGGYGNG